MKEAKKNWIKVGLIMVITAFVLVGITCFAIICCTGNLNLFTIMVLVIPTVCIALAALIIGFYVDWNWKRGMGAALILTLISFGTGQLVLLVAGSRFDEIVADEPQGNSDDDLTKELYDELDKKAYEYMLKQGLISEGEEIYGGEGNIGGDEADDTDGKLHSELYVGISKSDPGTELIGNILTFLIAFGMCFAGSKIHNKILKGHLQNS